MGRQIDSFGAQGRKRGKASSMTFEHLQIGGGGGAHIQNGAGHKTSSPISWQNAELQLHVWLNWFENGNTEQNHTREITQGFF